MALVDYSDSDNGDEEAASVSNASVKASKGTFQRVVDRSNPGKIRVSLPQPAAEDQRSGDEHPAKRTKVGHGGLSDFRSFLPQPKRTGQASGIGVGNGIGPGSTLRKNGLPAGVHLKTGAEPAFSRETENSKSSLDLDSADHDDGDYAGHNTEFSDISRTQNSDKSNETPTKEVTLSGKPLMFKPLSVSRNPAKKKKKLDAVLEASTVLDTTPVLSSTSRLDQQPSKHKVSLFSMSSEANDPVISNPSQEYQPIIHRAHVDEEEDLQVTTTTADSTFDENDYASRVTNSDHTPSIQAAQSLNEIASDLNLSAADRRQLFGRKRGGGAPQAIKVINFNTDEEYRHNEELRAAGEQAVHNPVRAIAPGKHSLKQLVNAAANQKEALEESFAKGKSNRAEASSRYGW